MSPQVTAALISGGAALVVALLGISGAIAAQLVATRRAFANSLRLFEQEYGKRERERAAEIRREDAYRFAEQRQSSYARLLRAAGELYMAQLAVSAAAEGWQHYRNPEIRSDLSPEDQAEGEEWQLRRLWETFPRWARLRAELDEIADEVDLVGSPEVRQAAAELGDIVSGEPDLGEARAVLDRPHIPSSRREVRPSERKFRFHQEARAAFLGAARADLGIGPASAGPESPMRSS